jgi:hypothetical protein
MQDMMLTKFVSPHRSKLDVIKDKEIAQIMESLGSGTQGKQSPMMSTFTSNPIKSKRTNPFSDNYQYIPDVALLTPTSYQD